MKKKLLTALLVSGVVFVSGGPVSAETLMGALAKAYNSNSALNSDRATVRIYDENIAIAKSGYRPSVNILGGYTRGRNLTTTFYNTISSIGIQLDQKIFDGFMTKKLGCSSRDTGAGTA
jgi:outer membrane protein